MDLKKLTDGELHEYWVVAKRASEAADMEERRRFQKRQRDAPGKLRWERSRMITVGPDGTFVRHEDWEAYVDKHLVGRVYWHATKQRWKWIVFQCGPSLLSDGSSSRRLANAAVERRVSRCFDLSGMPLAA